MGFIDANPALQHTTVADLPVLGGHSLLLPLVQRLHVDEVIVAITHRHVITEDLLEALLACSEAGLRVNTMTSIYERVLERVPVTHLGHNLEEALPLDENAGDRFYLALSRLINVLVAIPMLVLLAPVALAVMVANAVAAPGPLFYRQVRVGRGGRPFQILKFRTMRPNASTAPAQMQLARRHASRQLARCCAARG